jgi:hypothetical protein
LESGGSYNDAVAYAARGLGWNQRIAGTFVRAAKSTPCPKYIAELP